MNEINLVASNALELMKITNLFYSFDSRRVDNIYSVMYFNGVVCSLQGFLCTATKLAVL